MHDIAFEVGHPVALVRRDQWNSRIHLTKGKVERVTKTQVVALGGRKFSQKTLEEVGTSRSRFHIAPRLEPLTPELLAEEAQTLAAHAAEKKCHDWRVLLERARGGDAIELAALLPPPPQRG